MVQRGEPYHIKTRSYDQVSVKFCIPSENYFILRFFPKVKKYHQVRKEKKPYDLLGIVIGIESSFPYSRTFGIFPSKTSTFWSFIVKTLSEMHFKVAYSLIQVTYLDHLLLIQ